MMHEHIGTEILATRATVALHRPELHNAFNDAMIEQLTRTFVQLGSDATVRAVVLAAEGPSFCAGADVNWMKRMVDYSLEENLADANAMANMLRAIRECPKPVIARVHGAAIGGGVGLVAACDLAVALSTAVFSLSEVKLGIIPAVISPYVMEKIGPGAARRYALTAERFAAAEAKRLGLVSEVVDSVGELDKCVDRWCDLIKGNGPEALAACKRVLSDVYGVAWEPIQRLTVGRIAERRVSAEGQEGLKAFLEKRTPKWVS